MNISDVRKAIKKMRAADATGDHEAAGSAEKRLLKDFVTAIAEGTFAGPQSEAAKLIAKAGKHNHPRWYA